MSISISIKIRLIEIISLENIHTYMHFLRLFIYLFLIKSEVYFFKRGIYILKKIILFQKTIGKCNNETDDLCLY